MEEAYEKLGDQIIRCGNLDPVAVIQDQDPAGIRQDTKLLCEQEAGRPFILSGGCEVTVNTPPGHLKAMRDALF
jgi:uroporphyrinogen-III decarboxylase